VEVAGPSWGCCVKDVPGTGAEERRDAAPGGAALIPEVREERADTDAEVPTAPAPGTPRGFVPCIPRERDTPPMSVLPCDIFLSLSLSLNLRSLSDYLMVV